MDEGFETQLAEIRKQLELGLKQWQEDNAMLRLSASTRLDSESPAAVTLGEAIETLRVPSSSASREPTKLQPR